LDEISSNINAILFTYVQQLSKLC